MINLDDDIINNVLNTLPREYEELVDYIQIKFTLTLYSHSIIYKEPVRYKYQNLRKTEPWNS